MSFYRVHEEYMYPVRQKLNTLKSDKAGFEETTTTLSDIQLQSKLLNIASYFSCFFFQGNGVWRLMCRHCAYSCKINSCIFKKDANESAPWTGLLAWNLITSVLPFANEFSFLSLFFFPPGSMLWIPNIWHDSLCKKKVQVQMPISYFIQQSDFCFKRQKEKKDAGALAVCSVTFGLLLHIFTWSETVACVCWWCDSPWLTDRRTGSPQPPSVLFFGVLVSLGLCSLLCPNQSKCRRLDTWCEVKDASMAI